MKLKQLNDDHAYYTAKASDVARQMALGAIAAAWLFKAETSGRFVLPTFALIAGLMAGFVLILDLAQYAYGGRRCWRYIAKAEASGQHDPDGYVESPPDSRWVVEWIYKAKLGAVFVAYACLMILLAQKLVTH